jgi:hypothetical protein
MLDNLAIFSDHQAITGTALSAKAIQFMDHVKTGEPVKLLLRVTEDFNNLTSLTVEVHVSDTEGGSYTKHTTGPTIVAADLKAGADLGIRFLPPVGKPWVKLNYVVVGTAPTTGKAFAAVVEGEDYPWRDGLYFSPRNPSGAAATAKP